MDIRFDEQTVIVTGSGRGIGERIARDFGDAGANVVVTARTESEIRDTVERIEQEGGTATAVTSDLTDMADIDRLIESTVDAFGVPDVLVNNAGVLFTHEFTDESDVETHLQELQTMLQINMRGTFLLSERFAERRRDDGSGTGRIVSISSILGHVGVGGRGVYSATKSGIHGLTRSLAADFADQDITVNSVSPGLIAVDRIEQILEEEPERFKPEDIPAGRLGTPADVSAACLFLASEEAEYVNGQDLLVDGGSSITSRLYD